MPVVISLLNSYAGLAASATGFVIENKVLIIAGALDGASGFFLSILMSRAMNRSFANVLFGAVGAVKSETAAAVEGTDRDPLHAGRRHAECWKTPSSVIIVPGYGMAVAQAQHVRAGAGRTADRARHQGALRDPSGGRPHAGAHERAAGRGRRALRPAAGDGPHQRRLPEHRRGAGGRRQRRGEPGRPLQEGQPAVRHAHPRRRQGPQRHHPQAEPEARFRRRGQRAVLRPEDDDGLRRRQGDADRRWCSC